MRTTPKHMLRSAKVGVAARSPLASVPQIVALRRLARLPGGQQYGSVAWLHMAAGGGDVKKMVVVGGGPAGFMAAIQAARAAEEAGSLLQVTVLEATSKVLGKVKISGGNAISTEYVWGYCIQCRNIILLRDLPLSHPGPFPCFSIAQPL